MRITKNMGCAFTDNASTHDGKVVSDCRSSKKSLALVGCTNCRPGMCLKRCTNCYAKFSKVCARRVEEIERSRNGDRVFGVEALDGLFRIGWLALGRNPADLAGASATAFLDVVDGELQWRGRCPSCYTFTVPGLSPSMPAKFKDLAPKVAREFVVDFDARHLVIPSGLIAETRKPVRVEVVLLEPVISYEESRGIQFRAADPPEHDNYVGYWKKPPPCEDR